MNETYIFSGKKMLDTDGKPIQAHGGGLFFEDGVLYWLGENKEFTTGKSEVWTYGINLYSSLDFVNWKKEGLIIPPNTEDKKSSLYPAKALDRPHLLYCKKTKKYVCWAKISEKEGYFIVLTADHLLGPYTIERDCMYPFGAKIGDFDIWQDETGHGYIIYEHDHKGLYSATLSSDFLDIEKVHFDMFIGLKPPYTREGVTHFEHEGKHYLITSGMSGYIPNASEAAVCDTPLGPYQLIGNPHRNDSSDASFHSQISAIIPNPKKPSEYLTLADRWIPDLIMTKDKWDRLRRGFKAVEEKKFFTHFRDLLYMGKMPWYCSKINTSKADYVWLPLKFDGDVPVIEWKDKWKPNAN
jgi:hypothetical protein